MDNIKVKCFEDESASYLEKEINDFLSQNNCDILDIKHGCGVSAREVGYITIFSCIIIYKEKNN